MPYTSRREALREAARLLKEAHSAGVVDLHEIMSIAAALGKMELDKVGALLDGPNAVTRLKSLAEEETSSEEETATGARGEAAADVYFYGRLHQQQVEAALQRYYARDYDRQVGQRLLEQLSDRQTSTPIALENDARSLGQCFPLLGYRPVIKALVKVLDIMEYNLQYETADDYKRMQHILRLAGPPGLGKTTAATAIWAALHYACSNSSSLQSLFPEDRSDWEQMHGRIMSSLSPSKMLVFSLDFSDHHLQELQRQELELDWRQILALRLLYSVLSPEVRLAGYAEFLKSAGKWLRQRLTPGDVAAFVRQQAGFNQADKLLMVWVFDETQAVDTPSQPANPALKMAELLSAFVEFRVRSYETQSPTLPVCVTATTLRSSTSLHQTTHHRAKITDLQLLPLADAHCASIFNDVCERIKLCQQQQQQEQQQGSQGREGLQQLDPQRTQEQQQQQQGQQQGHQESQGQQQHMSDRAADVICQPTQWPAFDLQPSAVVNAAGVPLPEETMGLLQLVGGIPRLLSFALAAMAGEKMLRWQSQPLDQDVIDDVHYAKQRTITTARYDQIWWDYVTEGYWKQGTRRLLEIAFAHDVCQEPVHTQDTVVPPSGCRSSGSSSSKAVAPPTTWEGGEQGGLWLLMTGDGLRNLLSEGGGLPEQWGDLGIYSMGGYFVRVNPLMMAAYKPTTYEPPIVSLPVLRGKMVEWCLREQQDVGVLMARSLIASRVFGKKSMSLSRLLGGREPSQCGAAGLLGRELWLPQDNTDVQIIDKQLDAAEFDQLLKDHMLQTDKKPYAIAWPGNSAADGWLVLHQVAHDGPRTVRPGDPLIIFTSSKQRKERESVTATDIEQQAKKDGNSTQYPCVYACIMDQIGADAPAAEDVVISPQEHEAFYGCCTQLLRVSGV